MQITYSDERIRYTGRWGKDGETLSATAAGAYFEIAFTGEMLRLHFDTTWSEQPRPDLYLSLDGGPRFEAPIAPFLRITAAGSGVHKATILYKGGMEMQHRWFPPLVGKVAFMDAEAEGFCALEPDHRRRIEFVGDSITEGVLINPECVVDRVDQRNRPYQDDVTATYAYLTAEALDLRPYFMGYGAVGVTKKGCGSVPPAGEAYPYNFAGSPVTYPHPDYILINYGANDRNASPDLFMAKYRELLSAITVLHPDARIFLLTPFGGAQHESLCRLAEEFKALPWDIRFIDSTGWIPADPLHPLRDGHREVAAHLIPILRGQL